MPRGAMMAGTKTGDFIELITPFLRRKMSELEQAHGMESAVIFVQSAYLQIRHRLTRSHGTPHGIPRIVSQNYIFG